MGKNSLEKNVANLVRLGWVKSPVSDHMISPNGELRTSLYDIAEGRYPTEPTPPAEKEEWRNWVLENE